MKKKAKIRTPQKVRCMNNTPEDSKYGAWAPTGGCKAWVEIDQDSVKGLCKSCTSRAVNDVRG